MHDLGAESVRRNIGETLTPPLGNPLVCPIVSAFIIIEDRM